MEEKIFYENGAIKVTNARFIVANKTYAMNGVTSVKSDVIPASRSGSLWIGAIGVLLGLFGDGGLRLLGLAMIALAVFMFIKQKDTHAVVLSSASGEVQALSDTDENFIGSVVSALNDALVHRG